MEVIKRREAHIDKPVDVKCYKCQSDLRYTRADIKSHPREGDYIVCPVCGTFIPVIL